MTSTPNNDRPIPNSYWVRPGEFAAGEYPGGRRDSSARERLHSLLSAGVNHFIDLTEERDLNSYREIAQAEAERLSLSFDWERHPVVDMSTPDRKRMTEILDAIDSAMDRGKTVYVHCWGGIGRTGTVVGCWLRRQGYSGDEALSQIATWWSGVEKRHRRPKSPETPAQCQYIIDWTEERQATNLQ